MRLSFLLICLIALPAVAAESVSFRNDREGKSFYVGRAYDRAITRALKSIDETQIQDAFDDVLRGLSASKLCAYNINHSLLNELRQTDPKFDELPGAIYYLRLQNEMDDVVTRILLNAHKVVTTELPYKEKRPYIPGKKILSKTLPLIKNFKSKLEKNCLDEAYRSLVNDILKVEGVKPSYLEGLFYKARSQKDISQDIYTTLEQARENGLENVGFDLRAYHQKIKSLRLHYPLRDSNEKSRFVTKEADKMKMSHRQKLLESYTDIQIMVMGNIIKKLRSRLEAPKVEILIYDRADVMETITLDPMERFRLAVKLLRKEMSLLALNTYFEGRTPSYMDLMIASYELGIIPSEEVEEIAGLQEIWNPNKTLWEKARVWVQMLSTVATIVIPPPYGFLPALAIVVIEATTEQSKNANENDPTSLF